MKINFTHYWSLGDGFHAPEYFQDQYGEIPSRYTFKFDRKKYQKEVLDFIKERKLWLLQEDKTFLESEGSLWMNFSYYQNIDKRIGIFIYNEDSSSLEISVITHAVNPSGEREVFLDFFNKLSQKQISEKEEDPKIEFIVPCMSGGIRTHETVIKKADLDIKLNYGKEFAETDKAIKAAIEDDSAGLFLFHGEYGTGKTFYLRHLIGETNKKVIFLTKENVSIIGSPDFLAFLLKRPNSVVVIEDAEIALVDREENSYNPIISNLLNISDGLVGDALKIKVICTFNTPVEKIDKALLRKGRLVLRHEFKKLEVVDANLLLKSLGSDREVTEPTPLCDLYNIEMENNGKVQVKEKVRVGFN